MKSERQNKIIELITKNSIGTQEELAEALKQAGFSVTQATVSRDIRELNLTKTSHRWQKSEVCCLSGGQTAYERQIYPGLKGRVCRC